MRDLLTIGIAWASQFLAAMTCAGGGDRSYPEHPNVVHVTRPPYNAKGDGVSDDTAAIQRAINDQTGQGRILYFPAGTYLVSDTLTWPKKWEGRDNWGFTMLQGQAASKSVIKLKDGAFTDPKAPRAIMWCGGFGSADWFHNHVEDLTFDVGKDNPGAIALQFYSNNYGAVRNCAFVSADGRGAIGLDLGHRDMNGPLLVRRVRIQGFHVGIHTAGAVNSQTFEHIELAGQSEFGFDNHGQAISIRGLTSENAVPALRSYGTTCLIEAKLKGKEGAAQAPAIINYNGGRIFLRDVETSGHSRALGDVETPDFLAAYRMRSEDKPGGAGPNVREYTSHPVTGLFPSARELPRLPIEETPEFAPDPLSRWALADDFGADPSGARDSSEAIQKALDSGASTIFLPGKYAITKTLLVRGNVRRIVGTGGWVDYTRRVSPDFRVLHGDADVVTFEHFASINGGIENVSPRTLVLRSIGTRVDSRAGGKLFLEDLAGDALAVRSQRVFARQLNIENEGTHLMNDGADVWVLGYKTERGGTLVHTKSGGRTEVLGGFSYTTTAGKLAPMFINEEANVFTFFGEVCYNNDPFQTLVSEIRNGEARTLLRGQGDTRPYAGIAPKK